MYIINKTILTNIVLLITFIYVVILTPFLINFSSSIYTYVVNPLSWLLIVLFLDITLFNRADRHWRFKKETIQYTIIACTLYIIIYFLFGIINEFGKNPYSRTLGGILLNFGVSGAVIIMHEYVRTTIINSSSLNNRNLIFLVLVILFTSTDINFLNVRSYFNNLTNLFEFITIILLPIIIQHSIFTYLCLKGGYLPSVLYRIFTISILWISPVLPKHDIITLALINTIIPFFLFLAVTYLINKTQKNISINDLKKTNPIAWIPYFLLIFILIIFTIKALPWFPITVATNSMYPKINVGDIVIIKKCNITAIDVGDIINYDLDKISIIHRVTQKYEYEQNTYLITKGDNNKQPDYFPVKSEQIIGKTIFKIPYLGYPSIWAKSIFKNKKDIEFQLNN